MNHLPACSWYQPTNLRIYSPAIVVTLILHQFPFNPKEPRRNGLLVTRWRTKKTGSPLGILLVARGVRLAWPEVRSRSRAPPL